MPLVGTIGSSFGGQFAARNQASVVAVAAVGLGALLAVVPLEFSELALGFFGAAVYIGLHLRDPKNDPSVGQKHSKVHARAVSCCEPKCESPGCMPGSSSTCDYDEVIQNVEWSPSPAMEHRLVEDVWSESEADDEETCDLQVVPFGSIWGDSAPAWLNAAPSIEVGSSVSAQDSEANDEEEYDPQVVPFASIWGDFQPSWLNIPASTEVVPGLSESNVRVWDEPPAREEPSMCPSLPGLSDTERRAALLRKLEHADFRIKDFVLLVERWAEGCSICQDDRSDVLSAYAWSLLAVYFLQVSLPKECAEDTNELVWDVCGQQVRVSAAALRKSMDALFKDFVHFYNLEFDWHGESVSVLRGQRVDVGTSLMGHMLCENEYSLERCPCIEDPFDVCRNVSCDMSVDSFSRMQAELMFADFQCGHDVCPADPFSLVSLNLGAEVGRPFEEELSEQQERECDAQLLQAIGEYKTGLDDNVELGVSDDDEEDWIEEEVVREMPQPWFTWRTYMMLVLLGPEGGVL